MKRIRENSIFIIFLLTALAFQLYYLVHASANVPLMDYWKYINMFVEKMYSDSLGLIDIWQNDGIHRSPLQFIYFLLNVKFFHMDSRLEIYLGAVLMAVTATILYLSLKKDMAVKQFWLKGIMGVLIIIIVYNLNQYELINEQFALSFASRNILFLSSFLLTSNVLQDMEKKQKYIAWLGVFYVVVILSVGSGYFPAYVLTLGFTIVLHYLLRCREDKNKYLKKYIILLLYLVIGILLYMYGMTGMVSNSMPNSIGIIDFVKNFLLGVVTMLGVSIIGFEYSINVTAVIGCIIFLLYLLAFVFYFYRGYHKKTYVPVIFYGYSVGAMGLIYLGRMDMYGSSYAYSSRYVCETNVALIGFLWIVMMSLSEGIRDRENIKEIIKRVGVLLVSLVMLIVGILFSDYKEWKIGPYRGIYQENLIEAIKNVDSLVSEEFVPFQATEQSVRDGIDVMKKYELGIFYKGE